MFSTKQLFLANQVSLTERKPFVFSKLVNSGTTAYVPFCSYQPVLVDWDDGSSLETFNPNTIISHTYSTSKTAIVTVYALTAYTTKGKYSFSDPVPFNATILQWGDPVWTNLNFAFANPTPIAGDNIQINAIDWPNVGNVTDFSWCFYNNFYFTGYSYMNNWNMSSATTLRSMFDQCRSFNSYIGDWDVSNVQIMDRTFVNATVFNQDISSWNTKSLYSLDSTFFLAAAFNQPIGKWNTINCINFSVTFRYSAFNQDIGNWRFDNCGILLNTFGGFPDGSGTAMSIENYSRSLIGWANSRYNLNNPTITAPQLASKTLQDFYGQKYNNVNYGGSPFSNAYAARNYLTSVPLIPNGSVWSIVGDTAV